MAYGFETNTGVKFVAVVDMRGRRLNGVEEEARDASAAARAKGRSTGVTGGMVGLREGELKVVCLRHSRVLRNHLLDVLYTDVVWGCRCLEPCKRHMCGFYKIRFMSLMSIHRRRGEEGKKLRVGDLQLICKGLERNGCQGRLRYE
jgi:hypothetical protein